MVNWSEWLPDFKNALNGFYDEKLKETLENKSQEYKELFTEHLDHWKRTQQVLVVIGLGIFALLAIKYFWSDEKNNPSPLNTP